MKSFDRIVIRLGIMCLSFMAFGFLVRESAGKEYYGFFCILLGCGILLLMTVCISGIDDDLKEIYKEEEKEGDT